MHTYKFDTRISETGIISLPFMPDLFGREVEVIILPKISRKESVDNPDAISSFLERWAGAFPSMTDEEADRAKYDYLMEQYQR
jgi:hypothetical protein